MATAYDKARDEIIAGRLKAHALWMLLGSESERDGYGLKPAPWEGPGEYQRVSPTDDSDLGYLVRIPACRSLPIVRA